MPRRSESREVPYTATQMFNLVADIESYPEFIPWCRAARIKSRSKTGPKEVLIADLLVSIRVFRETLVSKVTLEPEEQRILVRYVDGPLKRLQSEWRFFDLGNGRSRIEYDAEFEFRSRVLTAFAEAFIDHAVSAVVSAFETRARMKSDQGNNLEFNECSR